MKPGKKSPIDEVLLPFQLFFRAEAAGGFLLFGVTLVALVWANSPWAEQYVSVWKTNFGVGFDAFRLNKPLILWINDALMAVFFFVVGLEIKREILVGELASFKKAIFPIVAAMGGMVVPALLYFYFNRGGAGSNGWGIPMATDIAFALGMLAILGDRVPTTAKIFLTAFAIIDDIGAALIIAAFYTTNISYALLGVAALFLIGMLLLNILGVRHVLPYSILGFGVWVAFLKSGVHPTLSGILAAFAIPASTKINAGGFIERASFLIKEFSRTGASGKDILTNKDQNGVLHALEVACEEAQTPLQQLEHMLHPWVIFLIMPIFALSNAGVAIGDNIGASLSNPVFIGVVAGLFFGKPAGVFFFSWVLVKAGVAEKPAGVSWRSLLGLGFLGGIGFTMALFIANLAFRGDPLLPVSKLGVLAASVLSGIAGYLLLRTKPASSS